jgi:membrane protein DedA with SNARE-associated domain
MLEGVWIEAAGLVCRSGHAALLAVVLPGATPAVRLVATELAVPAGVAVLVGTPSAFASLVGLLTAGAVVGPAPGYRGLGADERGAPRTYGERGRPSRVRVDGAQGWLSRWGPSVRCWGRFLPRLRGPLSAAAGVERTGLAGFLCYSAVGWAAYLAAPVRLVYLGTTGRRPSTRPSRASSASSSGSSTRWPPARRSGGDVRRFGGT